MPRGSQRTRDQNASVRKKLAAARAVKGQLQHGGRVTLQAAQGHAARSKSKHATPEEAAIEQLRIAKGVKAVMAVNAAARKAANAKGVATKKGGKGVVRCALTVMLMTAGCVNAAKQADAAAEQLRVEHEEFVVEEQRIGKAIEADEGAYRPRIQERNAKAIEKAAEKKAKEQEFLNVHYIGQRAPCKHGCGAEVWPGEANLCCRGGKYIPLSHLPLQGAGGRGLARAGLWAPGALWENVPDHAGPGSNALGTWRSSSA